MLPFLPLFAVSTPTAPGTGPGLSARYFTDLGNDDPDNLDGTVFADRVEGPINWKYVVGEATPVAPLIPYPSTLPGSGDNFAVKFSGRIYAPETGIYTFHLYMDDGACLRLDGTRIAINWQSGINEAEGIVELSAGFHDLYLAYKQMALSGAYVQLTWKKPSDSSFSVIPAANLYST